MMTFFSISLTQACQWYTCIKIFLSVWIADLTGNPYFHFLNSGMLPGVKLCLKFCTYAKISFSLSKCCNQMLKLWQIFRDCITLSCHRVKNWTMIVSYILNSWPQTPLRKKIRVLLSPQERSWSCHRLCFHRQPAHLRKQLLKVSGERTRWESILNTKFRRVHRNSGFTGDDILCSV